MNRIQEVQPNDTVLVTKMTSDASQHKKDTVKKCLLSLPKIQTEYDEDIVPVSFKCISMTQSWCLSGS